MSYFRIYIRDFLLTYILFLENLVQIKDKDEAITQLQTLLKNVISRQVSNLYNEPVGVFLSGGLDSSIVASLLVQAGIKVRAYTLDFGKKFFLGINYMIFYLQYDKSKERL